VWLIDWVRAGGSGGELRDGMESNPGFYTRREAR
jgi:hypothetical protein